MNNISIFIFWSMAVGMQSRLAFSDEFKHCNCITFNGRDYVMIDFDATGYLTRTIKCTGAYQLLKSLRVHKDVSAVVAVAVNERKPITWKPFLVRSCNEICRYASGINVGFTFNPRHLFSKLIKYSGSQNYEVLSVWRRRDGIWIEPRQQGG